jgi:hypothetical protein
MAGDAAAIAVASRLVRDGFRAGPLAMGRHLMPARRSPANARPIYPQNRGHAN